MDYAFAPGPDSVISDVGELLSLRADTTLIKDAAIVTLEQFIKHLETTASITKPVGSLYVVAHGNPSGWWNIQLDSSNTTTDVMYDTLEKVNTAKSIRLADALMGNPPQGVFHVRGCNLGKAVPYLQMLKQALGGKVTVTAPIHFYAYGKFDKGAFEYMSYEFRVVSKQKLADRAAAVAAFQAAGFTYVDKAAVPGDRWDKWVPDDIHQPETRVKFYVTPVPLFGGRKSMELERHWHYNEIQFAPGGVGYKVYGLPADPGTPDKRLDALRAYAKNDAWLKDGAWPRYRWVGFDSVDALVDGHDWTFSWDNGALVCKGTRHQYLLIVPITRAPATPKGKERLAVYNFYPKKGTGLSAVVQMPESNADYFATV